MVDAINSVTGTTCMRAGTNHWSIALEIQVAYGVHPPSEGVKEFISYLISTSYPLIAYPFLFTSITSRVRSRNPLQSGLLNLLP